MPLKLYAWTNQHFFLYTAQIAAAVAGVEVEFVLETEEMKTDKDFQAKKGHLKYPILELEDGSFLGESMAIGAYLLRLGGKQAMLGSTAWEEAQVDQWRLYITTALDQHWYNMLLTCLGWKNDAAVWNAALKGFSNELPLIEAKIAKSGWCVGNNMTLADILLWRIAMVLFSFGLGPEQRAALPAFTAWYEKMSKNAAVVKVAGNYHMTAQPWKLCDSAETITVGAPASAPAAATPAAAAEDDDMDLFGSDDEEDDQDARMAAKAAQLKAAGQLKEKKAVIAKSMILFEVKPLDSDTDLDVLANKIIQEVTQDGLQWKTEYKKAPVAFGIFKLIIGCTIEDDKVSSDDLVEKIEAFDEMVQSVDIAAFNKV